MKNICIVLFLISNCILVRNAQAQVTEGAFPYTERYSLQSEYMNEERYLEVYVPPSYYFNDKGNFPVLYLVDGDYNFYYNTAIVEQLSNVSGKIPEMIVVAISDKGNAAYRKDCTPNFRDGNAINFMSFIEKELIPFVEKEYRTSDYRMIKGHSLGGFLTTHFSLEKPEVFDCVVAIDPALWWGDYEIIERADSLYSERKEMKTQYFISLANTKEMGVQRYVGMLDKHFPIGTEWKFKHYPEENHGSLAMLSLKDALEWIFDGWDLSREQFYALDGAKEVIGHYKQLNKKFNTEFTLPAGSLGNFVYYYHRKELWGQLDLLEEEIKIHFPVSLDEFYAQLARNYLDAGQIEKAEITLKKSLAWNPKSIGSMDGLAKLYAAQDQKEKALEMIDKAIDLARSCKARQWYINELVSHRSEM